MEIGIDKNTLGKTTKCRRNFSCLSSETRHMCEVDYSDAGVLFVKPKSREYCPYGMFFGDRFICNCPTRKEIHFRHKI